MSPINTHVCWRYWSQLFQSSDTVCSTIHPAAGFKRGGL